MSSKKKAGNTLPGSKISNHYTIAKKQTKTLLDKSKKNLSKAKIAHDKHAKNHKSAEDNLKKHTSTHSSKPSKSTAKNVAAAKSKLKQTHSNFTKAQAVHAKAKDDHAHHQNHYDKLNHIHKAASEAEKSWNAKGGKTARR